MERSQKPSRWKRAVLIVLCVILTLILVASAVIVWYVDRLLGQIEYVDPSDVYLSTDEAVGLQEEDLETVDPDEELPLLEEITEPSVEPDPPAEPMGDILNILLIGQDRREGEGRARSDSTMLVTFNKTTGTISLTSFMRDAYVKIPGYSDFKLNHAFQCGGMSLLNETLAVNYGVHVDGDVVVDFTQFQRLIDLLGGVEVPLTQKEADHLNLGTNWGLTAGRHLLDGEQALRYSRIRYIDTDYRRAERQRTVVLSLVDKIKGISVLEMLPILEEVLGMVSTNMSKDQIVSLAIELFPMLTSARFEQYQIPAEGTFKGGNVRVRPGVKGWFQYDIDFAANRRILQEIFDAD